MSQVAEPGEAGLRLPYLLTRLRPVLSETEQPIYLVGGAVRDALLRRSNHDLDFVLPANAIGLAFKVGDFLRVPAFVLDRERDIGRVVLGESQSTLDFARFRGPDLVADLRARDFTINAMALPADTLEEEAIIDPLDGRKDLRAGIIRYTSEGSIGSDPVRALRAVRLSYELGFTISPETVESARGAAVKLREVSQERIRDELVRIIMLDNPGMALGKLDELALLTGAIPVLREVRDMIQSRPHHEPVLAHTYRVLDSLSSLTAVLVSNVDSSDPALTLAQERLASYLPDLEAHLRRKVSGGLNGAVLLRFGALFHDVGKAQTRSVDEGGRIRFLNHDRVGADLGYREMIRLRFGKESADHVKDVIANHMRPLWLSEGPKLSRRSVYRFFRDAGPAGIDVGLLALADELAIFPPDDSGNHDLGRWRKVLHVVEQLLEHYFRRFEETVKPASLVSGRDLINKFGLQPGPFVGQMLRLIEEAHASGEIENRHEAFSLVEMEIDQAEKDQHQGNLSE